MMTPSTPFAPFRPVPHAPPPRPRVVLTVVPVARPEPPREEARPSRAMELAKAAAAGDTDARRVLVAELAPYVRRVVAAILGRDHVEVDDVSQQALLALLVALPSFRAECEPAYFASRIAARTALVAARKTRAARDRRDDGVDVDRLEAEEREPFARTADARVSETLRALLERLAPAQAESLVLRTVHGWSLPEVAEATNAPLNTVRSRIRLAKSAMRAAIEADEILAADLALEPR